jgi:hypothetical protein
VPESVACGERHVRDSAKCSRSASVCGWNAGTILSRKCELQMMVGFALHGRSFAAKPIRGHPVLS